MLPQLDTLIADAAWQPYHYNPQQDALTFIHLPREAQRQAIFADPRFVNNAPQSAPVPISALVGRTAQRAPLHFIFHSAYCCSTLIARAFDIPGASMGHKEPAAIMIFGDLRAAGPLSPPAQRALSIVLDLFSRPLEGEEVQIIKPTNAANLLLPEILAARPSSKALLLHSDLDIYLNATVAKGMNARAFGRRMVRQFYHHIPIANIPISELLIHTDLQAGAHAWLMQMNLFARTAAQFGPERTRTLNSETLLARKTETLERLGGFFGVAQTPAFWDSVASGPIFAQHAKKPTEAYDEIARRETYDRMRERHGRELDQTQEWAAKFANASRVPTTLGDTIMSAAP